jgi:hypothetical protein
MIKCFGDVLSAAVAGFQIVDSERGALILTGIIVAKRPIKHHVHNVEPRAQKRQHTLDHPLNKA